MKSNDFANMKFGWCFLILALALLATNFEGQNLLQNSGFESEGGWGIWHDAEGVRFERTKMARSGDWSAKIVVKEGSKRDWYQWRQSVANAKPNSVYRLTGYVRTFNVHGGVGAYLSLQANDPQGRRLSFADSNRINGMRGWTKVSVTPTTPPETVSLTVCCVLHGFGEAIFDDLSLEELRPLSVCDPNPAADRFFFSIFAWATGAKGVFQWAYQWGVYNPLDDRDGSERDWCYTFPAGRNLCAPTPNWEAVRKGIYDWRYLLAVEQIAKSNLPQAREAQRLLNEARKEVDEFLTQNTYTRYLQPQSPYPYDRLLSAYPAERLISLRRRLQQVLAISHATKGFVQSGLSREANSNLKKTQTAKILPVVFPPPRELERALDVRDGVIIRRGSLKLNDPWTLSREVMSMWRCVLSIVFAAIVVATEAHGDESLPFAKHTQSLESMIVATALSQPIAKVSDKRWVLTIGVFPKRLYSDGQSVGFIVAKITNAIGQPLGDVAVRFSVSSGRLLTKETRTNIQGIAIARLQSERLLAPRKVKICVDAFLKAAGIWEFIPAKPKPRSKFDINMRLHWMPIVPDNNPAKGQWQCVGERSKVGGAVVPILHISPPPKFCWVDASFKELPFTCPAQGGAMLVKPTFKRKCCVGGRNAAAFRLFVPGGWTRLHNSLYSLRAIVTVSDGKDFWVAGEREMKAEVKNAVLSEVSINTAPILVCREVGESVIVHFTVDSLQDAPAAFRLKVYEWLTDNLVAVLEQRQRVSPKKPQVFEFAFTLKPEIVQKLIDQNAPYFFAYDIEVIVHQPVPEEKDIDYRCSTVAEIGAPVDERGKFITYAEYFGYDDKGTEEIEEDDEHRFLHPHVLVNMDGSSVKHGKLLMFDPDDKKVGEWELRNLRCLTHNAYDATYSRPNGIFHEVLLAVPCRAMEKAGTYYWTFVAFDDCPWRYKNHRPKLLLEAFRRPIRVKVERRARLKNFVGMK